MEAVVLIEFIMFIVRAAGQRERETEDEEAGGVEQVDRFLSLSPSAGAFQMDFFYSNVCDRDSKFCFGRL